MFTPAEKSNTTRVNRQQQTAGTTFFRKAGEDTFFGAAQQPSFFSPTVQAKLTVSSPDDPQEKEADAVADQVMRMPEPVNMPAAREEETLQKKEEAGAEPVTEVQHPVVNRMIQCKAATVQPRLGTAIQRSYLGDEMGSCMESEGHLSLYPSDVLQRSGRGPPAGSIPFEQSLSTSKGGGSALPGDTRQFMESRFNADFSGVRIHTGSHAESLSTQINAQAFTHGNDIYFNSGRYAPDTASGGLLLAHELTHTIQQGASRSHAAGKADTAVARKPVIQRNFGTPVSQPDSANQHAKSEEEKINANKEGEQEGTDALEAEQTIQSKNELGTWQVNGGGELVQPKEEERKEEEDKERSSGTPVIQKQHDAGVCCSEHGEEQIQRSVIDDALGYIDSVTDCISLDLEVAKGCALQKAQQVALHIPGYRALRVVLGRDPITSDNVDRNGRNFLEAAFDLMPGGLLLHQKLEEQHQLDAAAAWIDEQMVRVEALVNGLFNEIATFWNRLGITDLGSPMDVLRDAANIVLGFINRVIDFAVAAATELLEMIKEYLLTKIVDFIKTQTTAYPLLRVILGRDPVTGEEVPANGTTILNALLELGGEEGIQQRTQMQETGTFRKAVDFIDEGISLFSHTYDEMVTAFHNIWNIVTITSLMDPVGTFTQIYNQFAGPVSRVLDFVLRVGAEILKLIKEVLMQRLSTWAREQRGYELVTVIIGKDPFTNAVVPRNVENLILGFMSLMEGGREQFEQLKESGAIDRTVAKVNAAVARLNMTPAYIVQLFIDLWNSFSIHDLANPVAAFRRIIARFGEPVGRLIAFVITIVKIVIEAILIIMHFPFDLINNIITKAMQAFEMIKRDPVGFLKNLLRAIKQGFIQFFDNILQHLLTGLVGWLTSELRDAGVPAFADTSLRGIISWVLQVLGISMEKIWEKLAAHPRIGPQRVARIRSMINTLEGIWTFIKDVQERGMAAIWDKIKEQLTNLWDTILNAVKSWIMEQIVNRMVTRLLSMLDPTGIMAVVNSAIALYNAIQSFIKYLREMLEIVNSFVEGVVDIASGNITTAANYLERTLARAVPIVIGFLANQVGLNGIGHRVGEMIGRAREMVDQALTWLVNKAVDTAMNLLDRLMGRNNGEEEGNVKVRAKNRLNELIAPEDTEEQIQQKINTVKGELQSQGLTDLRMVPDAENEGGFYIDASASPFTHVIKLVKQLAGGRRPTARCQVSIKSFNNQDLSFIVNQQRINQQFTLANGATVTLPKTYAIGERLSKSEIRTVATRTGQSQEFAMIEQSGGSWPVGGALLIPQPGADEIRLMTWNTDTAAFNSASNASHAEYQFRGWLQAQPQEFLRLIKGITVHINLSPCDDCCAVLNNIVTGIVEPALPDAEKRSVLRQHLSITWTTPYCRGINANEKTTQSGVALLQNAGWSISGQVHENCSSEGFQKTSLI